MAAVTIIGIGDEGCGGLTSVAFGKIQRAQVLVGGNRQLEFFPDFRGHKISFQDGLMKVIGEIASLCEENNVVVLASGDPLFYGVGDLISRKIGKEHVEILPNLSSIQLAYSRIKEKWDDSKIISLHGRPIKGLINKLQHEKKVAILTDEENSPLRIANYLKEYKELDWEITVLENLGGLQEKISNFNVENIAGDFSSLNVVLLKRTGEFNPPAFKIRDDEEFAKRMPKKGLITKKEVRALAISNLEIKRDSVIWDIGAGSGSVSIESAKIAVEGSVYAIEVDPEGVEICKENAINFKTDNVNVIKGLAPDALDGLPSPDCVFIGGTKGSMKETLSLVLNQLRPGGRVVVSAITLDNVSSAYESFKELGYFPELELIQVSRGKKLAHYMRYEALNPIHLYSVTKKGNENE